jgi:hypothetical protein
MKQEDIKVLDVFLALCLSYASTFPEVGLIYWLRSSQFAGTAKLLMVQPTESLSQSEGRSRAFEATEYSIAKEEIETLCALLIEMGFPEREPHIRKTTNAESIWWAHLRLEVTTNVGYRNLEFGLGPEGITGGDAESLKKVLQTLLEMGNIQNNEWSNVFQMIFYGESDLLY